MTRLHGLVGDHPIEFHGRRHTDSSTVETYAFSVPDLSAWMLTISGLSPTASNTAATSIVLPAVDATAMSVQGWRYSREGMSAIAATLRSSAEGATISFDPPISVSETAAILVWVSPK